MSSDENKIFIYFSFSILIIFILAVFSLSTDVLCRLDILNPIKMTSHELCKRIGRGRRRRKSNGVSKDIVERVLAKSQKGNKT